VGMGKVFDFQGIAWVQSRGGEKVEQHASQTVHCPPGEEHWHRAARDSFMEHLAMLDNADDPASQFSAFTHPCRYGRSRTADMNAP
jgi:hypothetical protein